MPERPISVFLCDGQQLVREAIAHLLRTRAGLDVVGEAGSGRQAIETLPALDPDVAVVDVATPGVGGLEAARWLREHHARTEIVALSTQHGDGHRREAFEAGVRGYVLREAPFDQLVDAIQAAARGDYHLAGNPGGDAAAEYATPWVARQRAGGHITRRERELAVLLADGYSSKEAAAVLNISVRTADTHRASLMRKLDARNLADVVKYCIRSGLVGA
jgi:DNA-binding NarL/FixJ family response regulator